MTHVRAATSGWAQVWAGVACAPVFGILAYAAGALAGWDIDLTIPLALLAANAGFLVVPLLVATVKLVIALVVINLTIAVTATVFWLAVRAIDTLH